MTDTLVVDASVALKWAVFEPGSEAANQLLDSGALLVAPEHLLGEVGNGLRKRVAQRVLSPDDAVDALNLIGALEIEFVTGADRWVRSLTDSLSWGVTTYDALYVALALDLGAHLVTADRRLVASGGAAGLPVRPLVVPPDVPASRRP